MKALTGAQPAARTDSRWPVAAQVGSGVLAGLLGLAPWLVTGARLPLQNLWAGDVAPGDMPRVMLPFSQYRISEILGLMVLGGCLGGLLARASEPAGRLRAALWTVLGVALTYLVATIQTGVVVRTGLADDARASLYFAVMLLVIVIAALAALGLVVVLGSAGPPGAAVALTIAALALTIWLTAWVSLIDGAAGPASSSFASVARWLPALLVGWTLAWCGLGGGRHIAAWVAALILLWVIPAGLTAVSYAAGSRVLLVDPAEALRAGMDVFVLALGPGGSSLVTLPVALAVALAGLGWRHWRARAQDPAETPTRP